MTLLKIVRLPYSINHQSCKGIACTAARTALVCLGQDNLTEHFPVEYGLEFRVFLLTLAQL